MDAHVNRIQEALKAANIDPTDTDAVISFVVGFESAQRELNGGDGDGAADGAAAAAAPPAEDANGANVDYRKYGFIGVGTINSAVVKGLLSHSGVQLTPGSITLSPRNAARAAALADQFPRHVRVAPSNQEVIDSSDYVFVATPPGNDNTRAALSGLHFREGQVMICIIAGASIEVLREVCDCKTIVQAVPLPPAEHHCSTTIQWPPHEGVEEIFQRLGRTVVVPDGNKATAVASISCIMGDFYQTLQTAHEWLVAQGVDAEAASTAVGSYYATFNHASKDSVEGFQHLVDEQTPGGMNEKNINFLKEHGTYQALVETLDATVRRLRGE